MSSLVPESATTPAARKRAAWTGLLLIFGSVQFVVSMAVEEIIFPGGFSPISETISKLGDPRDPGSVYWIFNVSVVIVGLAAFLAAVSLWSLVPRRRSLRWGSVCIMLAGLGAIGVGFFPETTHEHGYFAFTAFFFSGLGLLLYGHGSRKVGEVGDFPLLTSILGWIDLISIVLFLVTSGTAILGVTERMIVAPVLLWAVLIGYRLYKTGEPVHVPAPTVMASAAPP